MLAKERQKAIRTIQSLVKPTIKKIKTACPAALSVGMGYEGADGTGCINSIWIQTPRGDERVSDVAGSWSRDIETELYEIGSRTLAAHVDGWENYEGSYGKIVLDASTGAIKMVHHWNVLTTTKETFEIPARKKAKK